MIYLKCAFNQTIEMSDRRFDRNLELLDTHMPQ